MLTTILRGRAAALSLVIIIAGTFSACKKKDSASTVFDPSKKGSIKLEFQQVAGGEEDFLLDTTYVTPLGDTIVPSRFAFYISNVSLTTADGHTYTVPKDSSYFLIDTADMDVTINGITQADYSSVQFTIGVDSAKANAPLAERETIEVLNPSWPWSGQMYVAGSGYRSILLQGQTTNARPAIVQTFKPVTVNLSFGTYKAQVRDNITPEVHTAIDANKLFQGAANVRADASDSPARQAAVASNLPGIATVLHVHND